MRNYLKIGMTLLFAITMFSCEKDDDATKKDSPLTFNDQTFNWNDNAELWHYSSDGYYDMNIFTGSLKIDQGLYGNGDWLNIEFYTTTLTTGEFIISDTGDEGTCIVDLDLDIEAHGQYTTGGTSAYFTTGTVKVEGSGNTYSVTIDATDDEGNTLKGTYSSSFALMNVY